MFIPDFLESTYRNFERTGNPFQRFHKFIHFNLLLLKYITISFYASAKASSFKTNNIDKFIYDNFSRPTEGHWLSLLEVLLSSKLVTFQKDANKFKQNLDNEKVKAFNQLFNLLIHSEIRSEETLTIFQYFQRIVSLKNRLVSHGIITEEESIQFLKVLEPLLNEIIQLLRGLLEIPLFLVEENDIEQELKITEIVTGPAINSQTLLDKGYIDNGLYFIINNNTIFLYPFLTCRDGNILVYNRYDRKNSKVFYAGSNDRDVYLRTSASGAAELFGLDKEALFLKPLEVEVKLSHNGIYHNLPQKDYSKFIGRNKELQTLEKMFLHRRHFINALDGIGGVGKSAIALEFCERVFVKKHSDPLYFEHIVWLSAKNTILKEGKIHKLEQSFEHLDQLLDTILDVLHFSEYKALETQRKKVIVIELLSSASALVVLDNLETLTKGTLNDVWEFINEIPFPSKVLLTSREYHYDVPQTLRVESLSEQDAIEFIDKYSLEIGLDQSSIKCYTGHIAQFSSGLPIAIKGIIGQLYLGKNFKNIQKDIENNTDNLAKFCFQQQLSLLTKDHMQILILICLSSELLDYESINYMISPKSGKTLLELVNELSSLSIIKISHEQNRDYYSIIPLIKTYILSTNSDEERIAEIKQNLNDYYELKDLDTYTLLPIEERSIDRGSLIPRKLVDKAMKHSDAGEVEQAEQVFKKVIKDYGNESYVWYMHGMYLAQYPTKLSEAINSLRKADELSPNYIYNKKIGDYHLQMKNFQAAVKNYTIAMEKSSLEQNKSEMLYCIANAEYGKVKQLRRTLKYQRSVEKLSERNDTYKNIIENLQLYVKTQPNIYDGKLIRIYRMFAESYFALKDISMALDYINRAIELSEYDDINVEFKDFILAQQ